jgi:Type III restriction enzyme, res subunit
VFRRQSAFSTAYVGSSNLTHSAQIAGMEWNVRVSGARNLDVIDKIEAVFESYWQGGDFVAYDAAEFQSALERAKRSDDAAVQTISPLEIRLEPFQERLLELIAVSRAQGRHRNLLVSATGTGKTVMAAIDYARLRTTLPRARLLFVAHREEILDQSRATFRHAMRDYAFGEKWVGRAHPETFDHVFASVQSLKAANLEHLAADHFDVVIIDEFHHAAAPSYRALLEHLSPRELLGLTATPERADGLPILHWFDDRIAAELRLWDAIEQHRLTPFAYYGIHDGIDLKSVPWRRGQGYDTAALSNVYTACELLRTKPSALSSISLAPTAGSSDSICDIEHCSVARAKIWSEQLQRGFPSYPPAAIWNSTGSRGRSCSGAFRKRFRPGGRPRWQNCELSRPRAGTLRLASTSLRRVSRSQISTPATGDGLISRRPPGLVSLGLVSTKSLYDAESDACNTLTMTSESLPIRRCFSSLVFPTSRP